MEFLTNNLTQIILIAGAIYPPLLFLLPVKYSSKIDLGVKIIKAVADSLERSKNTKAGFSNQLEDLKEDKKTYTQRPKF